MFSITNLMSKVSSISENITPIGDGNLILFLIVQFYHLLISENITPIGDGNSIYFYNITTSAFKLISENITPIGDGN